MLSCRCTFWRTSSATLSQTRRRCLPPSLRPGFERAPLLTFSLSERLAITVHEAVDLSQDPDS